MSDGETEIVKALKGIRTTLAWIAFWLFLIALDVGHRDVVDQLKLIVAKLK